MKIFTILLLALASQFSLVAQQRGVYMIHGYPGNQGSLEVGANYLREEGPLSPDPGNVRWGRLAHVGVVAYPNGDGVVANAVNVANTVRRARRDVDPEMDNGLTIAFGSSYGGLVARQIATNENGLPAGNLTFGGVITHGAPNAGAPIARNIDRVADWGGDFSEALLAPILMEGAEFLPLFRGNPAFDRIVRFADGPFGGLFRMNPRSANFIAGVTGNFFNMFADWQGNRQSSLDMIPGSPTLTALDVVDPGLTTQRQLTFAVEEEEDLAYRVLGGSVQTNVDAVGAFGGNEDLLVEPLIGMEAIMATRAEIWDRRVSDFGRLVIVEGRIRTRSGMRRIRDAHRDGRRALTSADGRYKQLAGFNRIEAVGGTPPGQCFCTTAPDWVELTTVTDQATCEQSLGTEGCRAFQVWIPGVPETEQVYVPNDGIVPVESQRAFTEEFQIEMPGDNHFSSNNSLEFRRALNIIFDGDDNPWFESE